MWASRSDNTLTSSIFLCTVSVPVIKPFHPYLEVELCKSRAPWLKYRSSLFCVISSSDFPREASDNLCCLWFSLDLFLYLIYPNFRAEESSVLFVWV